MKNAIDKETTEESKKELRSLMTDFDKPILMKAKDFIFKWCSWINIQKMLWRGDKMTGKRGEVVEFLRESKKDLVRDVEKNFDAMIENAESVDPSLLESIVHKAIEFTRVVKKLITWIFKIICKVLVAMVTLPFLIVDACIYVWNWLKTDGVELINAVSS